MEFNWPEITLIVIIVFVAIMEFAASNELGRWSFWEKLGDCLIFLIILRAGDFFSNGLHWPQIIFLGIVCFDLSEALINHGLKRTSNSSAFSKLLCSVFLLFLFYSGGFF